MSVSAAAATRHHRGACLTTACAAAAVALPCPPASFRDQQQRAVGLPPPRIPRPFPTRRFFVAGSPTGTRQSKPPHPGRNEGGTGKADREPSLSCPDGCEPRVLVRLRTCSAYGSVSSTRPLPSSSHVVSHVASGVARPLGHTAARLAPAHFGLGRGDDCALTRRRLSRPPPLIPFDHETTVAPSWAPRVREPRQYFAKAGPHPDPSRLTVCPGRGEYRLCPWRLGATGARCQGKTGRRAPLVKSE